MNERVAQRFKADGPKRILSIDGGGVRGIVAIAFLERIEKVLREQHGNDTLVLSDYFDLIGGTSVGSMIATQLAMGDDVKTVRERFVDFATVVFEQTGDGRLWHRYNPRKLKEAIQEFVEEETLASTRLGTGLCIVMKRMNSGSVWPVTNNPEGRYWKPHTVQDSSKMRIGNRDYKLWELLRSSTAAPTYFKPQKINLFEGAGDGLENGWFVDGGVSPFNNPALLLFMMAGLKGYNFKGSDLKVDGGTAWSLGAEKLLIISVGTGSFAVKTTKKTNTAAEAGVQALFGLMSDSVELGTTLLQWFSHSRNPWVIDRVTGDMRTDILHAAGYQPVPLLSFARYDMRLEDDQLNPTRSVLAHSDRQYSQLRDMTRAKSVPELERLARALADRDVSIEDFPTHFVRLSK